MVGHKLQCGKPQSLTWHTRAECNSAQRRAQALTGALIKSCSGRETRIEQRTEEAEIRGNIDVSRLARFRIYRSDRTLLCSRVGDHVFGIKFDFVSNSLPPVFYLPGNLYWSHPVIFSRACRTRYGRVKEIRIFAILRSFTLEFTPHIYHIHVTTRMFCAAFGLLTFLQNGCSCTVLRTRTPRWPDEQVCKKLVRDGEPSRSGNS